MDRVHLVSPLWWPREASHACRRPGKLVSLLPAVVLLCLVCASVPALAQGEVAATATVTAGETPIAAPEKVDVQPVARDDEIRQRLEDILKATGWYVRPAVRVQDGVVFLEGRTDTSEFKKWAGDLARSTQDVAAVVNQIEVIQPSIWDFGPAFSGLRTLWQSLVRTMPIVGFSLVILAVALGAARVSVGVARSLLRRRLANAFLSNVVARTLGLVVLLLGLYVVFYVAGLTGVALTLLGGTGLLGLVLGIAFRDITENFLASIFLSLQDPFRTGDLVDIAGVEGYVERLTTRATVLVALNGSRVQIPNATVYKSNLHNYTSNPKRREDFVIGIGYDDPILPAQELALKVLAEHPAVLEDPEPWVLVDSMGSATVNLRIYFWVDVSQYSWLKVRSSVMRLIKRAYQAAGVSMPDPARELIFPDGVPVHLLETKAAGEELDRQRRQKEQQAADEPATVATSAEGGLTSQADEIQEQARQSRTAEEGENLLEPSEPS